MADYIIFQQVKEQLLILQVELKKGKANNSASVQLRACDEFSRYIIRTIERIGKELSENDCKFFKIRISEGDIKRFKSKPNLQIVFIQLVKIIFLIDLMFLIL